MRVMDKVDKARVLLKVHNTMWLRAGVKQIEEREKTKEVEVLLTCVKLADITEAIGKSYACE